MKRFQFNNPTAEWNRDFTLLAVGVFAVGTFLGVQFSLFNNFVVTRLGIEPHELGWVEALREVPGFLNALFIALMIRIAPSRVAGFSLMVMGVGVMAYAHMVSVEALILYSVVWSIGFHCWMPLQQAMALSYSPAGDKGRFVLPPLFRKAVKESSDGRVLCLMKHPSWNCLVGFGLSRKPELEAQLDREEELAVRLGKEFDRDTRSSQLFGFIEMPFDDSGRFVMPDHLRTLGNIDDGLYFQGGGRFFTLWNPEELAQMGDDWAGAKAACESFLSDAKDKGAAKGAGK